MGEVYRFRNTKQLLGEDFRELEQQSIFFASLDDLNDPMEGARDIVWRGDQVLWMNLFRHYAYCLSDYFWFSLVAKWSGEESRIRDYTIPIARRWDNPPTPELMEPFNDVWKKVRESCQLRKVAQRIAYGNSDLRRDQLLYLLMDMHDGFVGAASETLARGNSGAVFLSGCPSDALHHQDEWLSQTSPLGADFLLESDFSEICLKLKDEFKDADAVEDPSGLSMMLTAEFPRVYVDGLTRLLWPRWYVSSFARNPHSISMWSHYADAHRGACLIFDVDEANEMACLALEKGPTGSLISLPRPSLPSAQRHSSTGVKQDDKLIPFFGVSYVTSPAEIDFFEAIIQSRANTASWWYTDEDGNVSERHINVAASDEDLLSIQHRYWSDIITGINAKTEEWAYEQEFRLLLLDTIADRGKPTTESRTLKYDFSSLKGIIFGMRTTDEDKLRILDVVRRKCTEHCRTDFKLFQAYYCPQCGDIRSRELLLISALLAWKGGEEGT